MRPAQTILTDHYLQQQLAALESRMQGRLLTQRNFQHEALDKVLEAQHDLAAHISEILGVHTQMIQNLHEQVNELKRPWWRRLLGRFGMGNEKAETQLYPCPICGAKDKTSHNKDCPRWDSGNVTVTPQSAALTGEGQ